MQAGSKQLPPHSWRIAAAAAHQAAVAEAVAVATTVGRPSGRVSQKQTLSGGSVGLKSANTGRKVNAIEVTNAPSRMAMQNAGLPSVRRTTGTATGGTQQQFIIGCEMLCKRGQSARLGKTRLPQLWVSMFDVAVETRRKGDQSQTRHVGSVVSPLI